MLKSPQTVPTIGFLINLKHTSSPLNAKACFLPKDLSFAIDFGTLGSYVGHGV